MNMNYCVNCMERIETAVCSKCRTPQDYIAPAHHMIPGSMLQRRYLVGRALGEGGFGITYIGRDTMLDMRVAIKEFYPSGYSHRTNSNSNQVTMSNGNSGANYEKDMLRFLSEARILAKFSDEPGIVGVRDFFQENGTAYIVMEYLDGMTLKEHLRRSGTMPPKTVFTMLEPVMVSLGRIHEENLVHRDISPDNIMVLRNGRLKLLDFGAARDTSGDNSLSVVLKHGYAPVEQYQSRGNQGPWTDVYALCATMYKCITGITPLEALERIYQDDLRSPSDLGVAMEQRQEAALMKGLQVRAKDRFQSMGQLRSALKVKTAVHSASVHQVDEDKTILDNGRKKAPVEDEKKTVLQEEKPKEKLPPKQPGVPNNPPKKPPEVKKPQKTKKKSGKKLSLAGALCAVLVAGFLFWNAGGFGAKKPDNIMGSAGTSITGGYELTLQGNIEDTDRSIQINYNTLTREAGNGYQLLNYMGDDMNQTVLAEQKDVDYLGGGLYTLRDVTKGNNCLGLVDKSGEVLLPCEAAAIQWADQSYYSDGENRYLLVAYAEEQTDTDAEMFLKYGDLSGFYMSGGMLFSGETGYKGFAKVYDTQKRAFVGDIVFNRNPTGTIRICGENVTMRASENVIVYDPNGTELFRLGSNAQIGPGILVDYANGTHRVLDEAGKELYVTNSSIRLISGTTGYLMRTEGDKNAILDTTGTVILELEGKTVVSEHQHIFVIKDMESSKLGLMKRDGTELVSADYYDSVTDMGNGLFYAYTYQNSSDNKYALIGDKGIIATGLPAPRSMNMFQDKKAFVLADAAFTLELEENYPNTLDNGLIATRKGADKLYGVYDLYTGKELLPCEYEYIDAAGEYLYAYKSGSWEVYHKHKDLNRTDETGTSVTNFIESAEQCAHDWILADCETAKTCSICHASSGDALGHTWEEANYNLPQKCTVCGTTVGEKKLPASPMGLRDIILNAAASSVYSGDNLGVHTPEKMYDGKLDTNWTEDASGNGVGEYVVFNFNDTYAINKLRIYGGSHYNEGVYKQNCRPKTISLTFSDGSTALIGLEDSYEEQVVTLAQYYYTDSIRLTIEEVYTGTTFLDTVIAELDFVAYKP